MVEAAKLNHIDTPVDEEFQIVGAGYKIHTPEFRKPMESSFSEQTLWAEIYIQ